MLFAKENGEIFWRGFSFGLEVKREREQRGLRLQRRRFFMAF